MVNFLIWVLLTNATEKQKHNKKENLYSENTTVFCQLAPPLEHKKYIKQTKEKKTSY